MRVLEWCQDLSSCKVDKWIISKIIRWKSLDLTTGVIWKCRVSSGSRFFQIDPYHTAALCMKLHGCRKLHRVFEHPSVNRFIWRKDRKLSQTCDLVILQMSLQKQEIGWSLHWRGQEPFTFTANHYAIRQSSFSKLQSCSCRWRFRRCGYYDATTLFARFVSNFPTFSRPKDFQTPAMVYQQSWLPHGTGKGLTGNFQFQVFRKQITLIIEMEQLAKSLRKSKFAIRIRVYFAGSLQPLFANV